MTAYEAAVQEKDQLYARIQLVREEIKQEQDPGRRGEQKGRLRILFEMYHESLDRLDALRPPQEKRHKAVKRTVIYTGAVGADVNSFDFFERCGVTFADLEGNQVRWDDLGSDNGESRARLMRALRRGRAAVSDRQREMLDLLLQGKTATEIAEQLDVNKATVSRTLLRAKKVLNDKAEDLRQEDLREHPNRLDLAEPETARYVLSRLTETQAVYLYLYYGEWLDMRSIGALLGVDHSTVCRTIHRAAGRIRALCTDGSGVELLGVDALEPALYALYRQHAADDLIPERAKAEARKAAISGCKKRQKPAPDRVVITAPIWGQHRHRAAAQSRLLRALEEAAAQCTTGSLLARLRALGKNVQYQPGAVEHLHAQLLAQNAHLRRTQLIIEHREVAVVHLNDGLELLHLAVADEAARLGRGAVLDEHGDGLAPGGLHKRCQLLHRNLT